MNRISLRTLIVITAAICMIVVAGLLIVLCVTNPANTPPPYESEPTDVPGTVPSTLPPESSAGTEAETSDPSVTSDETKAPETKAPETAPVTSAPETQGQTTPPETTPPETVPVASADYPHAVPLSAARDPQWMEEALIIGDSRTQGVGIYKDPSIKITWYAQQSLNISTAFTTKFINIDDPDNLCTILEAAEKKPVFKEVYFWFGLNDVGGSETSFVNSYKKLIDGVRQAMPDAEIYVISVLSVTQSFADSSKYGVNNANIKKFNDAIYQMCENYGYRFVYINEAFNAPDGTLMQAYTGDGAHLNKEAVAKLFEYLLSHTVR